MTIIKLLKAVETHIRDTLKHYSYSCDSQVEHPIYVKCGFLKERELLDDSHGFDKYVLIRAVKVSYTLDEGTAVLRIIFAAKDTDVEEGYISVINMMEHVKASILSRHFIGDKAFTYDRGIKWELDEEDTYPHYFGVMEISFYIGNPNEMDISMYQ